MFNCASFETDFSSIGSFKKIVFFILHSVFALDHYNREYNRELTRAVSVGFFSFSPLRNIRWVWREFEKWHLLYRLKHTRSQLVAHYYLTKSNF